MRVGFKGTFTHNIDHKGRVSIPSNLRRTLSRKGRGNFVITRGLDGCLFLFPEDGWERVLEQLDRLPFTKAHARRFTRRFFQHAYDVEADAQGRIKVPQELMKIGRLEKEILFLGLSHRIEVWNPHIYEKYIAKAESTFEDDAERVFIPGQGTGAGGD